jgi:hypothetical protein
VNLMRNRLTTPTVQQYVDKGSRQLPRNGALEIPTPAVHLTRMKGLCMRY